MSGRHQIKRQVLEVSATDPDEARRLQGLLERLQRQQIAPMIERLCDELGAGDQVQRIETLTIDLGEVDSEDFEATFMASLRRHFKRGLERALRDASEREDPVAAPACPELEALAIFARSGTLPWWSPTASPTILHDGLRVLLRDHAALLARLLADLLHEPRPLTRLVAHFDDAALAAMLDLLHRPHRLPSLGPEHGAAAVYRELDELAAASPGFAALPDHQRRAQLWRSMFTASARSPSRPLTAETFFAEVLGEAATSRGIDPAASRLALERRVHGPSRLVALLDDACRTCNAGQALPRLLAALRPLAADITSPADPSAWLRAQLARILRDSPPTQAFLALAREELSSPIAADLAPPLRDAIAASLHTTSQNPDSADLVPHATQQSSSEAIPIAPIADPPPHDSQTSDTTISDPKTSNTTIGNPKLSNTTISDTQTNNTRTIDTQTSNAQIRNAQTSDSQTSDSQTNDPQRHAPPTAPPDLDDPKPIATTPVTTLAPVAPPSPTPDPDTRARPPAPRRHPPPAPRLSPLALDLGFSATEDLPIGDAGLVLLWPFLGHFFTYLDLLHDKTFRDDLARQRAARLLRVCASGDPQVAEYQLPLARLLCGVPQTLPLDADAPIHEDEQAECARLLTAVIARATILRDMSIDGFRGTFLLRDGLLGRRDGHWLLRVERRAYDLVLDRFPWSFGWVKLPWMDTAIRVEW